MSKLSSSRTRRSKQGKRRSSSGLKQDSMSNSTFSTIYEEEGMEKALEKKLSRTTLLLLDYKQFKAARTIQTAVRGWLARIRYRRQRCAAIIIQRDWRRFSAQNYYYRILEKRVQDTIDEHHLKAAIKIQANWRGFLVREHIHDQYRMKRSQRMAAEDLMSCIAYKLHYLLRTYQIPGIYSLRNSHVLSKVEKILISISFKQDNKLAFTHRIRREADFGRLRKNFQSMEYGTRLPYDGPNFKGVCNPKCQKVYKEPNIDARMHQLLRKYEAEEMSRAQQKHPCYPKKKLPDQVKYEKPKIQPNFCEDIINSMRRWNMFDGKTFNIRPDIFQNPKKVENFLLEMKKIHDNMKEKEKGASCYCHKNDAKIEECLQVQV